MSVCFEKQGVPSCKGILQAHGQSRDTLIFPPFQVLSVQRFQSQQRRFLINFSENQTVTPLLGFFVIQSLAIDLNAVYVYAF